MNYLYKTPAFHFAVSNFPDNSEKSNKINSPCVRQSDDVIKPSPRRKLSLSPIKMTLSSTSLSDFYEQMKSYKERIESAKELAKEINETREIARKCSEIINIPKLFDGVILGGSPCSNVKNPPINEEPVILPKPKRRKYMSSKQVINPNPTKSARK